MGFEWDDLRYVLAVANAGSLAGAARSLGVNHTTVLRRIIAFEKGLGLRLFERLPTGYVLTAGGEELIAEARHIEDRVTNLEPSWPVKISDFPGSFASRPPTR